MKLTPEMIAKAKTARNVEELMAIAKTEGITTLTVEEAAKFYEQLNQKTGEIADDELDNVAGGGCFDIKHTEEYNIFYYNCVCPRCGSKNVRMVPVEHFVYRTYKHYCYDCRYTVEV